MIVTDVLNGDTIRAMEKASIRDFLTRASGSTFAGKRVLDYGCGMQPYRDIVEAAGGQYTAYDRAWFPANVGGGNYGDFPPPPRTIDTILCTQVVQYMDFATEGDEYDGYGRGDLERTFDDWHDILVWNHGRLVLTYPTTWPEVEPADLIRFTWRGMARLLDDTRFDVEVHTSRATIGWPGFQLALGYGVVARAR